MEQITLICAARACASAIQARTVLAIGGDFGLA
jgi:hypothetical protein